MLHTKFRENWSAGSGEEDFRSVLPYMAGRGGHLGHVTKPLSNFRALYPWRLHTNFCQF